VRAPVGGGLAGRAGPRGGGARAGGVGGAGAVPGQLLDASGVRLRLHLAQDQQVEQLLDGAVVRAVLVPVAVLSYIMDRTLRCV
jgi:hypothetical protein